MNLYDQTLAAESEVSIYRSANISEWIEAIDPVLKAAGECSIGRDTVDDISVSETTLTIRTSYSVRCCPQNNDMSLPISVLKADNPIQAATHYRLGNELAEAKTSLSAAQRVLTENTKKVALLEAELAAVPL
jgi:hypothetical protein